MTTSRERALMHVTVLTVLPPVSQVCPVRRLLAS
jgi:hypothetical protein